MLRPLIRRRFLPLPMLPRTSTPRARPNLWAQPAPLQEEPQPATLSASAEHPPEGPAGKDSSGKRVLPQRKRPGPAHGLAQAHTGRPGAGGNEGASLGGRSTRNSTTAPSSAARCFTAESSPTTSSTMTGTARRASSLHGVQRDTQGWAGDSAGGMTSLPDPPPVERTPAHTQANAVEPEEP